jgi:hypothetical protein
LLPDLLPVHRASLSSTRYAQFWFNYSKEKPAEHGRFADCSRCCEIELLRPKNLALDRQHDPFQSGEVLWKAIAKPLVANREISLVMLS